MTGGSAIARSKLNNRWHPVEGRFARAESDLYFSGIVRNGSFGKQDHTREPVPIDKQTIIRINRDTLYSSGFSIWVPGEDDVFEVHLSAPPGSSTSASGAGRSG